MRSSKWLWRGIGLVSLASALVLAFGFAYAAADLLNPGGSGGPSGAAATPPVPAAPAKGVYVIAALGDSLTKGTGDDTGEGYVKLTAAGLKARTGKPVTIVNNLAVNGLRADQLAARLKSDEGYRYTLRQANVILLTIGGNDLFQFAEAGGGAEDGAAIDPARVGQRLQEGIARLGEVVKEIGAINPDARLVYVGLYNPFYDDPELRAGSEQVQAWNDAAYRIVHELPNGLVVPTFDLFEQSIGSYLSTDHFHPNHAGYERIADRIVQALT